MHIFSTNIVKKNPTQDDKAKNKGFETNTFLSQSETSHALAFCHEM